MRLHHLTALLAGGLIFGTAAQAFALDAWRDRRGLYFGVGVGAGSGKTDHKDSDAHIGYNLRARVGGGVNRELTLDAELGGHFESHDVAGQDASTSIWTGMLGANYFVMDGLYVRGMFGVAQAATEIGEAESDETGMGFGAGVGYEFFASGDLAVGVGGDYRLLSFDDFNFTTINIGVTGTWY